MFQTRLGTAHSRRQHIGRTQRTQRLANRRRMVREIIDDRHTRHLGLHLQPPLHALEAGQSRLDCLDRNALPRRQRGCGNRVHRVVLTSHRQRQFRGPLAAAQQRPLRGARILPQFDRLPVASVEQPVPLDLAECYRGALRHTLAGVVSDQSAPSGNQIHHPLECHFYSFKVGVNIRMIELNMRQHSRIGKVM